jgi:hypothetical protein
MPKSYPGRNAAEAQNRRFLKGFGEIAASAVVAGMLEMTVGPAL